MTALRFTIQVDAEGTMSVQLADPGFHASLRCPPRVCKVERKDLGHLRLDRLHPLVTGDADTMIAVLDEVRIPHLE
jgi:hypothetical protein